MHVFSIILDQLPKSWELKMFFSLDLSLFCLRHILMDEAPNGPCPMPYGITKALGLLLSVALSSLAIERICHIHAVGIKH